MSCSSVVLLQLGGVTSPKVGVWPNLTLILFKTLVCVSVSALYVLVLCVPEGVLFWHQSEVTLHLGSSVPELITVSRVLGAWCCHAWARSAAELELTNPAKPEHLCFQRLPSTLCSAAVISQNTV